jgi:hypothetical protein
MVVHERGHVHEGLLERCVVDMQYECSWWAIRRRWKIEMRIEKEREQRYAERLIYLG